MDVHLFLSYIHMINIVSMQLATNECVMSHTSPSQHNDASINQIEWLPKCLYYFFIY